VKDENGDLLADSHNILNMCKKYFSQLLNVYSVSNVKQIDIHKAQLLVHDSCPFEVEIAIAKLSRYKLSGCDPCPIVAIQEGGKTINSLILFGIRNICQWKESTIVRIYKKGDKTDYSNYRGISLLSTSYKILSSILLSR
jgi:hypothetical protein